MAKLYFEDSKGRPKKEQWIPTYIWWRRTAILSWAVSLGLLILRVYG